MPPGDIFFLVHSLHSFSVHEKCKYEQMLTKHMYIISMLFMCDANTIPTHHFSPNTVDLRSKGSKVHLDKGLDFLTIGETQF